MTNSLHTKELLPKDGILSIHCKNIPELAIEMFKVKVLYPRNSEIYFCGIKCQPLQSTKQN